MAMARPGAVASIAPCLVSASPTLVPDLWRLCSRSKPASSLAEAALTIATMVNGVAGVWEPPAAAAVHADAMLGGSTTPSVCPRGHTRVDPCSCHTTGAGGVPLLGVWSHTPPVGDDDMAARCLAMLKRWFRMSCAVTVAGV